MADLEKADAAAAAASSSLYEDATAMQSYEMVQQRKRKAVRRDAEQIARLIRHCVPQSPAKSNTPESMYAKRLAGYITMDQPLFLRLRQQSALAYVGFRSRTVQLLNKWGEELTCEGNLLAHLDSMRSIEKWEAMSLSERATLGGDGGPFPKPTRVALKLRGRYGTRYDRLQQQVTQYLMLQGQQSRLKKTKTDIVTRLKKARTEEKRAAKGKKKKRRKQKAKRMRRTPQAESVGDGLEQEPVHESGDAGRAENTTLGAVGATSVSQLEQMLGRVEAQLKDISEILKKAKFNATQQKVAFKSLYSHKRKARDALTGARMNLAAVQATATTYKLTQMSEYTGYEIKRTDAILTQLRKFDLCVVTKLQELGLTEEQIK